MATIQSSLQLYDGMTGPLRAISNAMNITISTFESMQTASEHALDVAALQSAREELAKANVSVDQMERSIQMAGQSQDKFNRKIQDGQGIADGLGAKIKQFVGAYAGIQGVRMAVSFISDTVSLQNVQNEAVTDFFRLYMIHFNQLRFYFLVF